MLCERYNVSDGVGAALGTGALTDHGIITDTDKTYVIDRSKLRRERNKYRKQLQLDEQKLFEKVDAIYFDGKKDATRKQAMVNNKLYPTVELEEHYVVVGEPGEFYLYLI